MAAAPVREAAWRAFDFFAARTRGPLAIAHRGGTAAPGESALAAARRAVEVGVRFLELDVRATADGEVVVWHGVGVQRLRPGRRLDDGTVRLARPPRLEDYLGELPADVGFFLDVKDRHTSEALARLIAAAGAAHRVCLGSFSHSRTRTAAAAIEAAAARRLPTAMSPRQVARLFARCGLPASAWRAPAPSAQLAAWMATPRVIRTVHAGGALVLPWTVNDERTMHALLDRGVDGLMTDEPERLRRVLEERDAWSGEGVAPI